MATRIPANNIVVIQKGIGGISPRLQLQLGPDHIDVLIRRMEAVDNVVYERVAAERAEAGARGVQVVLEGNRPDHYYRECARPD
jgi:hypothetical protein